MSRPEGDAEDAMKRLVRAMVGHDDEAATSLARRVLGSQIGVHDSDRKQMDLSNCWRRISRKAAYQQHRSEMEQAYRNLERQCGGDDRELPPKVLTVLTKLMGKKMKSPPPFRQPSTSGVALKKKVNKPVNKAFRDQQIREERVKLEAEEAMLLKECLYSLQGIDGERIRYHNKGPNELSSDISDYEGVRVQSSALANPLLYSGRAMETRLGSGASDALRISGEAGWLYNRTQSYIHQVQHDNSQGVIARSFAGTLAEELREYHSLLASYEAKLSDLSLRQLLVDLRMPTNRLKILAMLTDGLRTFSGGHLLSALHKHTLHGDTRHANLVQSILCQVSQPWFDILYRWTTHGVLSDPHKEFFVTELPNVEDKHLWTDKYQINKDQIPTGILDPDLVGPAFNVGKGINFIRRCLLDGKWTIQLQFGNTEDGERSNGLGYQYKPYADSNTALQKTLKNAEGLVHSHILKTLKQENHIMEHLFALKQFLFLGQGDFFSALMEGLFAECHGLSGIVGIYKHSLLSIVEGALRSTNAKYLPQFCLDRLQVELLLDKDDDAHHVFGPGLSPSKQDDPRTVWDIFMLDYKVPDPLIAIVHPTALDKYKTVFRLLFNLKKVEFMLNYTWRQSATLQHALHTTARYNGIKISTDTGYLQATFLLRKISILRQSMMHLIVNLKSYLMFEVLEGGWQRLVVEIQDAKTLDEAIEAHDAYLNGIVRKSLLKGDSKENNKQHHLAEQVETLLSITNEFCDLQEGLFREALILADVASEQRLEAETRLKKGHWGFDSQLGVAEDENFFGLADESTLQEVVRISEVYDENAVELLNVLGAIVDGNPDDYMDENINRENETDFEPAKSRRAVDLANNDLDPQRFLMAQLDHNHYYGSHPV
jgi:gamma-tubulin complex component 3